MTLRARLVVRAVYTPPEGARFVGAREGLRLYLRGDRPLVWTYFVLGPGNVLLDFNGFGTERAAMLGGVRSLSHLAAAVVA